MTDALYLTDAYRDAFETVVTASEGDSVLLEASAFYPTGGGQPCDTGTLVGPDGREHRVVDVSKDPRGIVHRLEGGIPVLGTRVRGRVDWERRWSHMRHHTALHILSGVVYRRFGARITGGQIYTDRARMDFSLPEFSRPIAEALVEGINEVVLQDLPVRVRFVPREELHRDPSLVRVAAELLPDVETVRLIDIEGFDVQADGGTHVRSTGEVGRATLLSIENKGSKHKRLTLGLAPAGAKPNPGSD